MQPDRGESPCTPSTLIRIFRNGLASREADQPVFFSFRVTNYDGNPLRLAALWP